MKSNRKALLALIGALVAATAVAYGTGVFDRASDMATPASVAETGSGKTDRSKTAAEAQTGEEETRLAATSPQDGSASETASADTPAATTPAIESAQGELEEKTVSVPGFDVLRVEPGGDMVIAGTAIPGSKIEIVNGADVLTTADVGESGDFVAVLDERLKPGDYQIVLRATAPDGSSATSTGTAIVSVPETADGEVLALVEEPGKASRLISTTGGTGAETVASDSASVEVAAAGDAQPSDTAQAATEGETAPPAEQEDKQMAAVEPRQKPETETAEAAGDTSEPATDPARPDIRVAIEAVEIEGSQVFVAGAATPGHVVRVYANDILLGDARTSTQGRFLIETRRDLPEGDYIIRADVLAPNRADVVARAAVPFQRAPGENIAAVARPQTQGEQEQAGQVAQGESAPQPSAAQTQAPEASQQAQGGEPAAAGDDEKGARVTAEADTPAGQDSAQEPQLPQLQTALAETPPEITAAPLQAVDRSVIIRRGDTLWHISRRVYGTGIRYTTIYKANSEQIRDPDLIFPGQVFDVPERAENGEPADMSKLQPGEG